MARRESREGTSTGTCRGLDNAQRRVQGRSIIDDLLVHIGYHKTGTTWLQRQLFPEASLGFRIGLSKADSYRLLVFPRALEFDAAACRTEIEKILEVDEVDRRIAVVSNEELCANPHGGAFLEKELADRLIATVPGARILIVIREQRAMLASTYKQYIKAGATRSLEAFLSPPSLGDARSGLPDWRHYRYDALIRYYRDHFGAGRVLVIPYEVLRSRPVEFVTRLVRFCGNTVEAAYLDILPFDRRVNESLTALGTGVKRWLNHYMGLPNGMNPEPWVALTTSRRRRLLRSLHWLEQRFPAALRQGADKRMHAAIHAWAGDRFRESNAVTNGWVEDDLGALGYDL